MKPSIGRWLSLAFAPAAALVLLGLATPAHAVIVNDCNNIPDPIPSNEFLTVTQASGDCVINQAIKIDGNIIITIQNGSLTINQDLESSKGAVDLFSGAGKDITTKKLTAGNTLKMVSGGAIMVDGDVISSFDPMSAAGDGNILIKGQKNVGITGNVVNNGENPTGSRSGSIQIDAYLGDTPTPFTIGAASASNNGVGGYLDTRSTTAGGNSVTQVSTGIRIQNGVENSVGDIVVTTLENSDGSDLGNIRVRNSDSRSGWIELIAHKGKITLPAGKLTTRGLNNKGAGNIYLFADTIEVQDGTVINASQNDNAQTTKAAQEVILAARRIAIPDGSEGLTVNVNGGGPSASQTSALAFAPQGAFTAMSNDQILNLIWSHTINEGFFLFKGEVHFDGEGNAPLKLHANGDNSRLFITGYPIKFNGGDVTVTSTGDVNHEIVIGELDPNDYNGNEGLAFDNNGKVRIRANGDDGAGGRVQIQTDRVSLKANHIPGPGEQERKDIVVQANGDMKDGGRVVFQARSLVVDMDTDVRISADGATELTGNANPVDAVFINITNPGQVINLGLDPGQIQVTAQGGKFGGNGGKIFVLTPSIVGNTSRSIDASALSAPGGNVGDGGDIFLQGDFTVNNNNKNTIKAIGQGTGKGGKFTATTSQQMEVNRIVKVDGGDMIGLTDENGFIQLNNIQCRQWATTANIWPKAYWNCASAVFPPEFQDRVWRGIDSNLPADFKRLLRDGDYTLHIFRRASDYNTYYVDNAPSVGTLGVEKGNLNTVNVWTEMDRGDGTFANVEEFLRGHAMHEIGHAVDDLSGFVSQQGVFMSAVNADIAHIRTLPCTTVFGSATFNAGPFCATNAHFGDAWDILHGVFIKNQDDFEEMFTFGFQNCSGFGVFFEELDNAEAHMDNVNKFFAGDPNANPPTAPFYVGGCR